MNHSIFAQQHVHVRKAGLYLSINSSHHMHRILHAIPYLWELSGVHSRPKAHGT